MRQRACLETDTRNLQLLTAQEADQGFGSLATFTSRKISPRSSTMHTLLSSKETSNPA